MAVYYRRKTISTSTLCIFQYFKTTSTSTLCIFQYFKTISTSTLCIFQIHFVRRWRSLYPNRRAVEVGFRQNMIQFTKFQTYHPFFLIKLNYYFQSQSRTFCWKLLRSANFWVTWHHCFYFSSFYGNSG